MRNAIALAAVLALAACGLMPPEPRSSPSQPPPTEPVADAPIPQPPPPPPATPEDPPPQLSPPFPGYRLAWHDEFDGSALDAATWTPDTNVRRNATNTPDAVAVTDGTLSITTYTDAGVHRTGFLTTDGKVMLTYGYFEARIRFSDAPGEWCAFWLQSPTNGVPLGDPAHAGVEIDLVEHRVTDQTGAHFGDYIAQNLNWDGYDDAHRQNRNHVTQLPKAAPVQGAWHTYAVLWTPTSYVFYVDGFPLWSIADAVSQRSESIQLTCEVEHHTWAGDIPAGGYGARAASTTKLDVDWVRVWQQGT
jgi:beta-glucanase (GH16 family)